VLRRGIYIGNSCQWQRGEAETSQFTQTDSQSLTSALETQVQTLHKQADASSQKVKNIKDETQNLHEEIEKTLRQIEQSEPQLQKQP